MSGRSRRRIPKNGSAISSPGDSPAKILVRLTQEHPGLKESDPVYGGNSSGCFAFYDQEWHLWKTFQLSLFGGLVEFSETLPNAGLMRNGRLYLRAPSVLHTHGKGCSLWPTPRRINGGRSVPKDGFWVSGATYYTKAGIKMQVGVESRMRFVIGPGPLAPNFMEWLMGFPPGWTELTEQQTPSSPK